MTSLNPNRFRPTITIDFSENTEVADVTAGKTYTSFAAIDAVLRAAALRLDASDRSYDKTSFKVEIEGDAYTGRIDLQHPSCVSGHGFQGLAAQMAEHAQHVADNALTEVERLKGQIWVLRVTTAAQAERLSR